MVDCVMLLIVLIHYIQFTNLEVLKTLDYMVSVSQSAYNAWVLKSLLWSQTTETRLRNSR